MEGVIVNFRGGLHTQRNDYMIVKIDSVNSKSAAEKLVGKKVVWTSPAGKQITGIVTKSHGNKGAFRVKFEKGMPGQSVSSKVRVE